MIKILPAALLLSAASLGTRASVPNATIAQEPLKLTKISQTDSPKAKCLDGSPPAYYWRDGVREDRDKAVLFFEGGGWCYPSDVLQSTGANCAYRAKTGLGSSTKYAPKIASTGYEGGSGYLSGDPRVTAWSDWAVAYVKYCDGGSMTGTREDAMPARNGSGPIYYRGHYNLVAQLDNMVSTKGLGGYKQIVLSGCSAGGMACYLKCDFVSSYFAKHSIPVKCICDAGLFLDVDTVTGAGNVMRTRYHDIAEVMESKPGLSAACVGNESDWKQCIFSQYSLKYMQTPTFAINSLYNFGEWAMLCPTYPRGTFPPDTGTPPSDWHTCYPSNGALTPETYKLCNATQIKLIQGFRDQFVAAVANAADPSTPHGLFLDSCPNEHCQTSTGWTRVSVGGTMLGVAAADWYFKGKTVKLIDKPFPGNPTCGQKEGHEPICSNCANKGLGSNCLFDSVSGSFHGHEGPQRLLLK